MQIKIKSGEKIDVSVNILPVISGTIHRKPVTHLYENASEILNTIALADTITKQHETCKIEILLGNDYYLCLFVCLFGFYGTSTHKWPYRAECYNRLKILCKTL
jgi:hypothetical protein